MATVVLDGAAVVEAPVPVVAVALVVVVEAREVDVLELDELLVHAPSADPVTRAATAIAATRAVIRMVLLLHTPD
ncbi:MAG: hypothetical protein ACLPR9_18540 [Acidimicrobiales bacterium]